ncbi:MAG: 16S rRNA (uracil(1498)-N(3))-methyltransferase [Phycisphaerae bacterium]|nr:16S rRNA (uracil(1498)-N(3))-methyltransferase [Phycisphaerae bacterium]
MHRFYADDLSLPDVRLDDQEAHHAGHVLRLADGSEVELFDGRGGRAVGRLRRVGRGKLVVTIERREAPRPRPRPAVHLAFSTPKGKRLDWLLEKATELGAASLQPVIFHRSVAGGEHLNESKRKRWRVHCIAAAKQSGLDFLPELRPPARLGEVLGALGGLLTLLGDPSDQARAMGPALAGLKGGQDILLLVGPEGGLTDDERAAALAAGVLPVRLGETILRIETAAVGLLAATVALCRK